jgi:hypothetical protein
MACQNGAFDCHQTGLMASQAQVLAKVDCIDALCQGMETVQLVLDTYTNFADVDAIT